MKTRYRSDLAALIIGEVQGLKPDSAEQEEVLLLTGETMAGYAGIVTAASDRLERQAMLAELRMIRELLLQSFKAQ